VTQNPEETARTAAEPALPAETAPQAETTPQPEAAPAAEQPAPRSTGAGWPDVIRDAKDGDEEAARLGRTAVDLSWTACKVIIVVTLCVAFLLFVAKATGLIACTSQMSGPAWGVAVSVVPALLAIGGLVRRLARRRKDRK
jgi:hypothetical protein